MKNELSIREGSSNEHKITSLGKLLGLWLSITLTNLVFDLDESKIELFVQLIIIIAGVIAIILVRKKLVNSYSELSSSKEIIKAQNESIIDMTNQVPGMIYQFLKRQDGTSSFLFASQSVKNIYRISPEDLYRDGSLISKVIHPDDHADIIKAIKESVKNLSHFYHEYRVRYDDGTVRWLRGTSMPNKLEDGSIIWNGYISDITDQKNARDEKARFEQQLHQGKRLESLGILAGGIAHDFNNILSVISTFCYMLKSERITPTSRDQYIEKIEKSIERAAELSRQMLSYAGKEKIEKTNFNFNRIISETTRILHSGIEKNIALEINEKNTIEYIFGDISQIRQIIMDILLNAKEAIGGETGTIKIETDDEVIENNQICVDFMGEQIPSGSYICLTVTDSGCGMDNETKERIFEPFYSTKFLGRGLGLSAALGIISSHNGYIIVESELGVGTSIKILLPTMINKDEFAKKNKDAATKNYLPEIILIAEDEEDQRIAVSEIFFENNLISLLAKNGEEAIEALSRNKNSISLIILDDIMPIMKGSTAFAELRKISPEKPILFCSGNDLSELEKIFSQEKNTFFIQKPFNPEVFISTIKKILSINYTHN
jgi:signal transduction histidine kinase/CheY-like chemotaxis protein